MVEEEEEDINQPAACFFLVYPDLLRELVAIAAERS